MVLRVRELTAEEHGKIERVVRAETAPVRLVRRARTIDLAVHGATVPSIARQLTLTEKAVRPWIERFNAAGLDGLTDAPRSGRPPTYTEEFGSRVLATLQSDDPDFGPEGRGSSSPTPTGRPRARSSA